MHEKASVVPGIGDKSGVWGGGRKVLFLLRFLATYIQGGGKRPTLLPAWYSTFWQEQFIASPLTPPFRQTISGRRLRWRVAAKKVLTFQATGSFILLAGKGVMFMEVKEKFSLCPACSACPEVEILHENGKPVAVRIGEGAERIILPAAAWNTLIRYAREGILPTL